MVCCFLLCDDFRFY